MMRNFLEVDDLSLDELQDVLDRADTRMSEKPLAGKGPVDKRRGDIAPDRCRGAAPSACAENFSGAVHVLKPRFHRRQAVPPETSWPLTHNRTSPLTART